MGLLFLKQKTKKMDFDYAIQKLKKGYKLAQLEWENGFTLGCIDEDDNVHIWYLNEKNELVRYSEEGKLQEWDCTEADSATLDWVLAIPFKKKYLKKLGLNNNKAVPDLYYNGSTILKIYKKKKTYEIKIVGDNKRVKIHFVHEFINWCKQNNIKLPITIETDCIEKFLKI